ncbi:MAG: hypothetical protein OXJ52_01485 [Oligoflexia bacterium]|nr:hypothetical protein [Oligoflexia bacterium]
MPLDSRFRGSDRRKEKSNRISIYAKQFIPSLFESSCLFVQADSSRLNSCESMPSRKPVPVKTRAEAGISLKQDQQKQKHLNIFSY